MSLINPLYYQSVSTEPLVLIVEADENTRLMMKYLLKMWKYQVIETADIQDALEITNRQRPNFILFSGSAQSGGSLTVIKRMREMLSEKTEIIFISAFSEPAIRTSALAAGANDFLVKPIDFGRLEKILGTTSKTKPHFKRLEMFL